MEKITKEFYGFYKKREQVKEAKEIKRKELPTEQYERLKNVIKSYSDEKKKQFERTIKIEKKKEETKLKQLTTFLTFLGILLPMAFTLILNAVTLTNIENHMDKVLDIEISDYQIRTNVEIEKRIEAFDTKEEKQKERENVIKDLQNKIENVDNKNVKKLNEETKKETKTILSMYIGAFFAYVALILVEAIRSNIANRKILYYEYCEMMLKEVREEKGKKKKK